METTEGTRETVEQLGQGAHRAVDAASRAAAEYAERLGQKSEELARMRDEWVEQTRGYVREHPIAAVGIAVAAGYLLGMMMRGR